MDAMGMFPEFLIRPYFFLVPLPLKDVVLVTFFPKCAEWDGKIYQAISSCENVAIFHLSCRRILHTPRKANMSPENQWLEDVFPIEIVKIVPL